MDKPINESLIAHGNNITKYSVIFPAMSLKEFAAVIAFFILLIIVILIGNGLIFSAFIINRKLRSVTNKLVLGLAVSDLLVGLISIPCWIYILFMTYYGTTYSHETYQFYITFDIFVGSASILQLTSISIERCHAIVRPLMHRTLSRCSFRAMITIPWVYSIAIAVLQPIQYDRWQKVYTLLMAFTCFLLPFVVILAAYICIYITARSKPASFKLTRRTSQRNSLRNEIRLSVTVAVITLLFLIAWLPLFVLTIIATYFPSHLPSTVTTHRLLKFAKWMHYSNSSINPFIYAFRNNKMLRTFRFIISKVLCGRFKPRTRGFVVRGAASLQRSSQSRSRQT